MKESIAAIFVHLNLFQVLEKIISCAIFHAQISPPPQTVREDKPSLGALTRPSLPHPLFFLELPKTLVHPSKMIFSAL